MSKRPIEDVSKVTCKRIRNTVECGEQTKEALKFDIEYTILMLSKMKPEDLHTEEFKKLIASLQAKEDLHSKILRNVSTFADLIRIPRMDTAFIEYCKETSKLFE
jgi:protein associated with RNAse G/E